MKPAEEWHSKFGASEEYTAMWDSHCVMLIRQIQIDALEFAKGLCRNELDGPDVAISIQSEIQKLKDGKQ